MTTFIGLRRPHVLPPSFPFWLPAVARPPTVIGLFGGVFRSVLAYLTANPREAIELPARAVSF